MISENISIVLREKKKEQNMIMTPVAVELHESMTHIKNSNRFTSNDDNFYFFFVQKAVAMKCSIYCCMLQSTAVLCILFIIYHEHEEKKYKMVLTVPAITVMKSELHLLNVEFIR